MARLFEVENGPSLKKNSLTNNPKTKMETLTHRKLSFKTKPHGYNHQYLQPKLVATKVKISSNSTVAELANKFNTILISENKRDNKTQTQSKKPSKNSLPKKTQNTVREVIQIFEHGSPAQDSINQNSFSKDESKKPNAIILKSGKVIRKVSSPRMKKSSLSHIHEQSEQFSHKRPKLEIEKGTTCETCASLEPLPKTSPIKRPYSMASLNVKSSSKFWPESSQTESKNLILNVRNNLRHTSMINLNQSSQIKETGIAFDHSNSLSSPKSAENIVSNETGPHKPELKPKPMSDEEFLKNRRKSVADIQSLLMANWNSSNSNTVKTKINVVSRGPRPWVKTNEENLKSSNNFWNKNCLRSVSSVDISRGLESTNTMEELNNEMAGGLSDSCETLINELNESDNERNDTEAKKNLELEEKVMRNPKLSIPKISLDLENVLNLKNVERNLNMEGQISIPGRLDSDKVYLSKLPERQQYENPADMKSGEKNTVSPNCEIKCEENVVQADKIFESNVTNSNENNEKVATVISKTEEEDSDQAAKQLTSTTKPNSSFLYRQKLSKENTPVYERTEEVDDTVGEVGEDYTYIEVDFRENMKQIIVKNNSTLHESINKATYQSLPNLNQTNEIDDTYEELNYFSPKIDFLNSLNQSKDDNKEPVTPEINFQRLLQVVKTDHMPSLLEDWKNELIKKDKQIQNSNFYENEIVQKKSAPVTEKYACVMKPKRNLQSEPSYTYESIVDFKMDSEDHYAHIGDEVYDDVLNVLRMDNCYESIRAQSECGSTWEKDNSIYGIKAPSVVSNPSTISTDTTVSTENYTYRNSSHDEAESYTDSFDSDSDVSEDFNSKDRQTPVHEKSLPPPPTSSTTQLNQNIYGFVKQAGRQMKKRWSLSSLGLNKISKMGVGAISQLTVVLPKSTPDEADVKSNSNGSPPVPLLRSRRWNSFKSKFRPTTTSTFYLNEDEPPDIPAQPSNQKTEPYTVPSAVEKDKRRQSIAFRPSSPPPPPPPINRSLSAPDDSSVNPKSENSVNPPSWYADCGLFDSANPEQISEEALSDQSGPYWCNSLWDLENSNSLTPAASASDSMSDPGSDLHLRFIDEPLYQFYNACVTELQFNEEIGENGYEEIGSSSGRPSMMEIVKPSHVNRSLWCQLPEVLESGLLDTLDPSERKLQEAKFELITSEASHFKSLTILEKHFIASPLLANESVLSKDDRKQLFGNVSAVRKCSEKLLAALESCWQSSIRLENICEVVYHHVTNKNFNIYIKYCGNQFHIDRTLKTLRQNNKFCEALAELEKDDICQSLSLHSFLMLPMQRITRLPLLFDAILTRLKPNHSEYETCHTTLATLNKIVHECNEEARKMERYYEMLLLSRLIKFSSKDVKCLPVISSKRWLIRSGSLTFVNMESKLTFNKKMARNYSKLHLFLFTDLLVITKKKSDGSFSVIDYCPRAMMQMSVMEDSVPPSHKYLLLLTILENHETKTVELVLSCDTESARQRWLEATLPPTSSNPEETLYEQWDCPQVAVNHTYTAQQPDELNLQPGDVINVLKKMSDGWYHGERIRDGQIGWFPGNYTSEIASSHARAKNLKQRYRLLAISGNYLQMQAKKKTT